MSLEMYVHGIDFVVDSINRRYVDYVLHELIDVSPFVYPWAYCISMGFPYPMVFYDSRDLRFL